LLQVLQVIGVMAGRPQATRSISNNVMPRNQLQLFLTRPRIRVYASGTGRCLTGRVGWGRVRVRSPQVRVYPFLPVKNREYHFLQCWSYIECFYISSFLAHSL